MGRPKKNPIGRRAVQIAGLLFLCLAISYPFTLIPNAIRMVNSEGFSDPTVRKSLSVIGILLIGACLLSVAVFSAVRATIIRNK